MSCNGESSSMKDFKHAFGATEEVVAYLASIIPKEDKDRIRMEIKKDPEFKYKHSVLRMKVRDALRFGGFSYFPENIDILWFVWLKKAVNLPEEKLVLTDSVKERIGKYKEQELLANPPVCSQLAAEQINYIKKQLEEQYRIKIPEVEVRYSEYAKGSLSLGPPSFNLDELVYVKRERDHRLKFRGLREHELTNIDSSKHIIFLATRQPKQRVGLYASAWHELAHVAARILGIKDRVLNESFAMANEFRGLLQATKEGVFEREKVVDMLEYALKQAEYEQVDAAFFSRLKRMGVKGISRDYTNAIHYSALNTIKKYNPELRFQNRDPDELLAQWDNTIKHILNAWNREKWKSRIPIIFCLILLEVLPIILIAMVILFS